MKCKITLTRDDIDKLIINKSLPAIKDYLYDEYDNEFEVDFIIELKSKEDDCTGVVKEELILGVE